MTAEPIRLGLFHTDLNRKAPGHLYRDILRDSDDVTEAVQRIVAGQPDILVLLGFDYDLYGVALRAFAKKITAAGGLDYPHPFALRPNTGLATGLDLDRNGRLSTPRDAQGYGRFSGEGGMAILSRFPVAKDDVQDFSDQIWAELPWANLPQLDGAHFFSDQIRATQRLSTSGHWIVSIALPNGDVLRLLTYHATPPVFDGPEDRNGLRNADETRFWVEYLQSHQLETFAIVGGANLDPLRGDGRRGAIQDLLAQPSLQDPFEDTVVTVDWSDIGLGKMRVDYILPSLDLRVERSGTIWPDGNTKSASQHALIWVDLATPDPATPSMLESSAMTQ